MPRWIVQRRLRTRPALATSVIAALLATSFTLAGPSDVTAETPAELPSGFHEERVAQGFPNASALAIADTGEIFVAGKSGDLWILDADGVGPSRPALKIDVDEEGEHGLVGIAVHPDFADNGWIYVQYTAPGPPTRNRVSRFTVEDRWVDSRTEEVLLELDPLSSPVHAGGGLAFGADGMLYVGTGDDAQAAQAQSLDSLLGKVLRITPGGEIPRDNPFYEETAGTLRAIFAYGLRNVFTIDADTATDRIYVNDTGAERWEEINELRAGANYGWPEAEGPSDGRADLVAPLYAYEHGPEPDRGCAIDGGAFYDADGFPDEYAGAYLFVDYCANWMKLLRPDGTVDTLARGLRLTDEGASQNVSLAVGADGAAYWLNRESGALHRIRYTGVPRPLIGQSPDDLRIEAGGIAVFRTRASGAAPLEIHWLRDGTRIEGATGGELRFVARPEDDGAVFRVVASNPHGTVTSQPARVDVRMPAAQHVSNPPTWWRRGEPQRYDVTIVNHGTEVWNASGTHQVRLAVVLGGTSDAPGVEWAQEERYQLPADVAPGETTVVTVEFTPEVEGEYRLRHRLVKEDVTWFPQQEIFGVIVEGPVRARWLAALVGAVAVAGAAVALFLRRQWR